MHPWTLLATLVLGVVAVRSQGVFGAAAETTAGGDTRATVVAVGDVEASDVGAATAAASASAAFGGLPIVALPAPTAPTAATAAPVATAAPAPPVATAPGAVAAPPPLAAGAVPPPGFKFELGAWLVDPDTPGSFNRKLGHRLPSYQSGLSIPYNATGGPLGDTILLDPIPGQDYTYLWNVSHWDDNTDASVFMTVYADQIAKNGLQGLDLVTDDAMIHLAIRLSAIPYNTGRQVRMRWLPEMNGHWMLYGLQPARYIAVWQRMFTIFRRYAPNVILVWSPNYDLPFGDESYWPGAEYVDWVGTSVYWKGFGVNAFVSKDYSANSISSVYLNFAQKYNKPFVISEASGAWEIGPGRSPITGETFTRVTNQVDQATFQQSFWAGIISPDIFAAFPLLRAAYLFEVAKQEEFWSDFRIANDTSVLTSFKELIRIADAGGWMTWANTSTFVAPSAPQPIPESVSLAPSTNEWPTALPTGIKIPKVTAAKSSASSSFALVALLRQEQQQGIVLSLFFALLSILV